MACGAIGARGRRASPRGHGRSGMARGGHARPSPVVSRPPQAGVSMSARMTVRTLEGNRVEASSGDHRMLLDALARGRRRGPPPRRPRDAAGGPRRLHRHDAQGLRRAEDSGRSRASRSPSRTRRPPSACPTRRTGSRSRSASSGPLDAEQKAKLLEIAKKCPVYKTLTSALDVVETLA